MAAKAPLRPASSSERSRASRLRRKREAGLSLSRSDKAWLKRYEAARRLIAKGALRSAPIPKAERDRAYRLRRNKRLTKSEREWLKRYERRVKGRKRARTARPRSAKADAREICDRVSAWILDVDVSDIDDWIDERKCRWFRKPLPGRPGVAICDNEWLEPALPPDDYERRIDLPYSAGGRLANVRVRVEFYYPGEPPFFVMWTSLVALTSDWETLEAKIISALTALRERPSIRAHIHGREDEDAMLGITAVSVMVKP